IAVFCPGKSSSSPADPAGREFPAGAHRHCLVLLLRKENASHHIPALLTGLMEEVAEPGLGRGHSRHSVPPAAAGADPALCFHGAPYSEAVLHSLGSEKIELCFHGVTLLFCSCPWAGGSFSAVPEPHHIPLDFLCHRVYAAEPGMEQVVMLTVVGMQALKSAGELLQHILLPGLRDHSWSAAEPDSGFELLGLKWLPHLTRCQARAITPLEAGDTDWQSSLDTLTSSPVLVCALRAIDAFRALAAALQGWAQGRDRLSTGDSLPQALMALTPEVTFRQAILFFTEEDLVTVGESWRCRAESLFSYLQAGAQVVCTVLLIKPGVWSRGLPGILRDLHLQKFTVVGMKHLDLEAAAASALLPGEVQQDAAAAEAHCTYLTSGTALVLCLQRPNAVKKLLDLLGPEDPQLAQALDPCLWRAQYGTSTVQNGFYGSRSYPMAVRDVKLFFPEGLCCAQCQTVQEQEIMQLWMCFLSAKFSWSWGCSSLCTDPAASGWEELLQICLFSKLCCEFGRAQGCCSQMMSIALEAGVASPPSLPSLLQIHNLKHDPILSLGIRKQRKILTRDPGRHPSALGSEQPGSPGVYRQSCSQGLALTAAAEQALTTQLVSDQHMFLSQLFSGVSAQPWWFVSIQRGRSTGLGSVSCSVLGVDKYHLVQGVLLAVWPEATPELGSELIQLPLLLSSCQLQMTPSSGQADFDWELKPQPG
ncbi:hypothetical protein IHE44_0004356, partial [Lamprotornis superbus]